MSPGFLIKQLREKHLIEWECLCNVSYFKEKYLFCFKCSKYKGVYMRPKIKFCSAMRKTSAYISFIVGKMKWNSFVFWSFDLLSLLWWNICMHGWFHFGVVFTYLFSPEMKFYHWQNHHNEIKPARSFSSGYLM